jgi:hypothetical protein
MYCDHTGEDNTYIEHGSLMERSAFFYYTAFQPYYDWDKKCNCAELSISDNFSLYPAIELIGHYYRS